MNRFCAHLGQRCLQTTHAGYVGLERWGRAREAPSSASKAQARVAPGSPGSFPTSGEYRRALASLPVAPDLTDPFRPGLFARLIPAVLVSRRNCETVPKTPLSAGRPGRPGQERGVRLLDGVR